MLILTKLVFSRQFEEHKNTVLEFTQDQRTKTITGRFEPVKYSVSVFIIIIIVGKKLDRRTYGKNYN